jgi:hypothetical protein
MTEELDPFLGYSRKTKEIEINGVKYKVKPKIKDAEMFMLWGDAKKSDPGEISRMTDIMVTMIKRGNPVSTDEDIRDFVAENYGELFLKLGIVFGFTTEEKLKDDMDKAKKKAIELELEKAREKS